MKRHGLLQKHRPRAAELYQAAKLFELLPTDHVNHSPTVCLLADRATRHRARAKQRPYHWYLQSLRWNACETATQVADFARTASKPYRHGRDTDIARGS
ncbi:MAG: hypothetical protein DCC65_17200 [Planctomycetota bacterium]|nr:MAG: hypothetical protein DCC65_17200 [Planctomycetota bacterium]